MSTLPPEDRRMRHATVHVLGEDVLTKVDVPDGATVEELIRAAGTTPRTHGWDLFLDGTPTRLDAPVDPTRDSTLAYVPRIRGG